MLLSVGGFSFILATAWAPAFAPVTPSPMPTHHATVIKPGVVLAHSLVPVHLTAPLKLRSSRMGQHFNFVVARDVSVGGVVVIPRCTFGDGIVSRAGRRGISGGVLHLQFESLHPADGTTVALDPVEAQVRGHYRTLAIPPDATLFVAVSDDTYPPAAQPACSTAEKTTTVRQAATAAPAPVPSP
jgi:hypothetical protein